MMQFKDLSLSGVNMNKKRLFTVEINGCIYNDMILEYKKTKFGEKLIFKRCIKND